MKSSTFEVLAKLSIPYTCMQAASGTLACSVAGVFDDMSDDTAGKPLTPVHELVIIIITMKVMCIFRLDDYNISAEDCSINCLYIWCLQPLVLALCHVKSSTWS